MPRDSLSTPGSAGVGSGSLRPASRGEWGGGREGSGRPLRRRGTSTRKEEREGRRVRKKEKKEGGKGFSRSRRSPLR